MTGIHTNCQEMEWMNVLKVIADVLVTAKHLNLELTVGRGGGAGG